jgi:hypothetical protein
MQSGNQLYMYHTTYAYSMSGVFPLFIYLLSYLFIYLLFNVDDEANMRVCVCVYGWSWVSYNWSNKPKKKQKNCNCIWIYVKYILNIFRATREGRRGWWCSYITKLGIFIKKNPQQHLQNPKTLRLDVSS